MTDLPRMQAVHAAAYPAGPDGDPICATCHHGDCPRYWRIQQRLDQQEAARRASLPPAVHGEEIPVTPLADWQHQDPGIELLDRIHLAKLHTTDQEQPHV